MHKYLTEINVQWINWIFLPERSDMKEGMRITYSQVYKKCL